MSASGVLVVLHSELERFQSTRLHGDMQQTELILVLSAKVGAFFDEYFCDKCSHLRVLVEIHEY